MLFNVLLLLLVLCVFYIMAIPFFVVKVIKIGVNLQVKPEIESKVNEDNELYEECSKEFAVEAASVLEDDVREPIELSPEEKRALAILENVETYDGTGIGQKEIKDE